MMTDGNSGTVTEAYEETKEITDKVTTADDALTKIHDAVTTTAAGLKEIPDSVETADEYLKDVPDVAITTEEETKECQIEEEFVPVPKDLKRYVIGMGGSVVKKIRKVSGATIVDDPMDEAGFAVTGNKEQIARAKKLISQTVEGAQITHKENALLKVSYYINEWNIPAGCKLKLEQIAKEDGILLSESFVQYRIKPVKVQESYSANEDPTYMSNLECDTLQSLRRIKTQMETKRHLKAEIWCHFGTVIVRQHKEEDKASDGEWTIEEATSNLRGNQWKTTFKGGVNLNEKVLQEHAFDKTPQDHEDFSSRYDLTFVMPNSRQIKLWVWVTKKGLGKRLEDIPIPSGHIKNVLEEIHFKDELTRSRCRGWLVLPYQRYLRTDILFPGCEFDCRLTITGYSDRAHETGVVPDEDTRRTLTRYLSEVTFDVGDDFGLRLPEGNVPDGFQVSHMRCTQRAMYGFMPGYTIVLSKEISKETTTAKSRVSSAFYLVCDEWEDSLNTGMWEPEALVKKLPEFFRFVTKVQSFVLREMKETGLTQKVPPEILARGSLALKAYTKALADGKTFVKRVPIMLIGQDRAGKTSLKKSLRGICFNPEEDSTTGIDVDPSPFKITKEMWRTGTTEKDTNPDAAISFDHHTAMLVAENVTRESDSTLLENGTDEVESTPGSKVTTETPTQLRPTEASRDAEHIQLPSQSRDALGGDANHVPLRPSSEQDQEDFDGSPPGVPEEVAVVTETLLQETWEDNRKDVYSTLWDFAGQSVYYETHPLFLTARAIYCLVYDLSLDPHERAKSMVKQGVYTKIQVSDLKTNFDYLDFWMMSVASMVINQNGELSLCAKSEVLPKRLPPVFLVCTHADTRYDDGRDPKELAGEILDLLKRKPYGTHLHDVFAVDNRTSGTESECSEVKRLRQEVLLVAKELPYIDDPIPIKWLKFEKVINTLKEDGKKYISLKEAKEIASKTCRIKEDLEIKTLIDYLHDLRSLIHFDDSPQLNKLVVLDPQWLIDVFKKVITVRPYDCKKKKFEELWCKLEREGILEEELLAHVWGPLYKSTESYETLARIMEKFSLLCPWPSEASKSFLVPSMLKTRPQKKVTELVSCARIPSLFINFAPGLVPPGLFHRFVLQFFQWGSEIFLKPVTPQLFRNFVRFVTTGNKVCSVIFVCHQSSLEVVIVGDEDNHELAAVTCAGVVCTQVGLMLESMRNEFHWLSNMRYEMSVRCPVCCQGGTIDYCRLHDVEGCSEEHCLHFWTLSELFSANETVTCLKSPSASKITIRTQDFAAWFDPSSGNQLTIGEMDRSYLFPGEGHEEKALALPNNVLESLSCLSNESKEVAAQFAESLQLEQAFLEQPNSGTKALIRCFSRNALRLKRPDVVKHLREKLPAGTTGPLLPEHLVVQKIPLQQLEDLTYVLSAGDEWKRVAEKLGLTPDKIRYLDKRVMNPADTFLAHLAKRRHFTVGELYDILCECHFPVLADKL